SRSEMSSNMVALWLVRGIKRATTNTGRDTTRGEADDQDSPPVIGCTLPIDFRGSSDRVFNRQVRRRGAQHGRLPPDGHAWLPWMAAAYPRKRPPEVGVLPKFLPDRVNGGRAMAPGTPAS